jgi:exoribonuclease-2
MLMTGEAVARFALEHDVPVPFTVQEAWPSLEEKMTASEEAGPSLAQMFALRRSLKRSQPQSTPGPHTGLGMERYTQSTSPLRRYLDLVVHQQLRAYLRGQDVLDGQAVMERVGAAEAVRSSVRRAERLSITHWTLVYLLQHPDWQGEGVIVDKRGARDVVLIPELDLETRIYQQQDLPLDSRVWLRLTDVNLALLEAHFRVS